MKPIIAHEYLLNPAAHPAKPVCVVYGNDPFLRSTSVRYIRDQVLAGEDAEFSLCHIETGDISFKDALKELQTAAMFGGGRRVVRIDEADKFITNHREQLENYLTKPSEQSVLILQLSKSFDARTKLYRQAVASGLLLVADAIPEKEAPQWLVKWSKQQYNTSCDSAAAKMIVERVGAEHGEKFRGTNEGTTGLLDQELAKLSLMADAKKGITAELVEQSVGSWRSRTAFVMLNLALDGKTAEALQQLNALMWAGETPVGIVGQLSSTLQKFATATELILDAERRNSKISVRSALEKAGVKSFFLGDTERQLRLLGRHRGARLAKWLLQLDFDLKGDSKTDKRVLLERFIVTLSSGKLRERAP